MTPALRPMLWRRTQTVLLTVAICSLCYVAISYPMLSINTQPGSPKRTEQTKGQQPKIDPVVSCYPLGLPNLREVVQDVLAKKKVNVGPINNLYSGLKFGKGSATPCGSAPVDILLLIKSAAKNEKNRETLRSMWANMTYLGGINNAVVKYAFLLGTKQFPSIPPELIQEAKNHSDVVFIDYVDNFYRNNTFKTMGALKWTLEHCGQARYIALVDDDIFLNVKNLARFLQNPAKYPRNAGKSTSSFDAGATTELFAGKVRPASNFRPHRNPKIPWYVSWDEYPVSEFPIFFPGMTTIFSFHTLQEFYVASRYVKHLSIDDVYLGLIATKLGVQRRNLGDAIVDYVEKRNCTAQPKMKANVISIHLPKDHERRLDFWRHCRT